MEQSSALKASLPVYSEAAEFAVPRGIPDEFLSSVAMSRMTEELMERSPKGEADRWEQL